MKWSSYLLCFIFIAVGTFCGISLFREVKATSYINGSIDITNKFSQESFSYYNTSLVFYHDIYDETDTYIFEKDLLKVEDFNGTDKEYKVVLNNYVLTDCDIKAGSIFSTISMDFYNTDGEIVCPATMQLSIKFLSNKTQLTLTTKGQKNSSFFEQYFKDNGIRLQVLEII